MSLNKKTLGLFALLIGGLIVVLVLLSAWGFRHFSLYMAERHAISVAETVKIALTESMINGTIDKRQQFLDRLADLTGVAGVRVARGPTVVRQHGPGFVTEVPPGAVVDAVLASGIEHFAVVEGKRGLIYRAVIPYIATDLGSPNCLQCHLTAAGATLGAISIDVPVAEVRLMAGFVIAGISLAVLLTGLGGLLLLRRLLRPLIETADEVRELSTLAVGGDFRRRVGHDSNDEVGEIARNLNRLMDFLEREIGAILARIGELTGQRGRCGGNQMVQAVEMVESLVDVAQFKKSIEEDRDKEEIYRRLSAVIEKKHDFRRYSIYEVASSKNRIAAICVDGEENAACRWCDAQIVVDAAACRAQRTGHAVDGIELPGICPMFRAGAGDMSHFCLPINRSGNCIAVVQIVAAHDEAPLARLMAPYLEVYLREAGPVLEAKRLMEHLKENALRDAMTGLYNRRFLDEYAPQLLAASQRRQSPFAVLMLDLDFFKQVNDSHGHQAGDKVLKTLADILARSVRTSDIAVRYGGEEFLIVLVDTPVEGALTVAEKIRAEVEGTRIPLPGGMLRKTLSIGIAIYPQDADSFWQVVKFADVALYQAKQQGRNRVLRFSPEMWDKDAHY